jgi:tetratricopeptide (TPR) repeat protein
MTQADLDALIAGTSAPAEAAPDEPQLMTQADLDALIAGASSLASTPGPASGEPPIGDGHFLDAPDAVSPDAADALAYSQADIDALINGQADEAAPLASHQEFDAVLGNRREDDALGRGGLDSLLVGHDPGEDISVSDEHVDALLAELDRPRASAVEEEPLSQDLLDAILASAAVAPEAVDVGLENLAAAASTPPPDPTPLSADDLAELLGASLLPPADAEPAAGESDSETPVSASPSHPIRTVIRRHPLRLAAAIAAGFLAGAWTYIMLDAMRVSRPSLEQYIARQDAPLDVVNAQARRLIDEGAYGEAVTLLDAALARTHASPERSDAAYLRVEALYKGFSGDAYTPEYDALHARIDDALSNAPQHPRAAEALLWKARLYALAELPYAEADVYATIIANHGDTAGLDSILHDAARLALKLDEPLKAVEYTRQLMQNFPGSPHAGGARLLMADAYRRAGTLDDARTLYVRVAQSQPGTPAGAEAHYRLGEMSFAEGNYARAIQDLSTYLSSTTTAAENAKVFLLLAKAYAANGQLKEAHDRLEELINFFPESDALAEAYVVLSQVLEDEGQRDNAVNLAMQAAARFPNNPMVLQNSGEFLGLTGNAFGAATALVNAHAAGAGNPELLLSAARYFRVAGMPGNARDTYDTLRAAYPRSAQALTGVVESAVVLYDEGDAPQAMSQLEEMLATTKGRPERLDGIRALMRMTREMGIADRTVELATEAAGLSEEPEVLAESALALFEASALAQGQEVFNRVDLARVRNKTAFELLMGLGRGLLQVDPLRGLGRMEEAYLAYPNIRTPQSDLELLNVYLATGRAAAARRVVMELASHVSAEPVDTPVFLDAATAWGDWLYGRGDYRAAADAYAMVVDGATVNGRPVSGIRSDPGWAKFQQANALFELANYTESLPIYEAIAASDAPWAQEARIKADHAQLEQRLRGLKTASSAG